MMLFSTIYNVLHHLRTPYTILALPSQTEPTPKKKSNLSSSNLTLLYEPGEQIHFGHHRNRFHFTLVGPLGYHCSAVPLEEPAQGTHGRIKRNLHKFPLLRYALRISLSIGHRALAVLRWNNVTDVSGIRNDFRDLRKAEHDIGDRALPTRSSLADPTEKVPQCN